MLRRFLTLLQSAMRNETCLLCATPLPGSQSFCLDCQESLGISIGVPKKRLLVSSDAARYSYTAHQRVMSAWTATLLNPRIKKYLYGYKFYKKREYASLLGGVLIQAWQNGLNQNGLHQNGLNQNALVQEKSPLDTSRFSPSSVRVVIIPPHSGRKSLVDAIARRFAYHFGYTYEPEALQWGRPVMSQHGFQDRRDRFKNIQGSLFWQECYSLANPAFVLIVDDILTSGATLLEARRAIMDAPDKHAQVEVASLTVSQVPMRNHGHAGRSGW